MAQLVGRRFLTALTGCPWSFDSLLVREQASRPLEPLEGNGLGQKLTSNRVAKRLTATSWMPLRPIADRFNGCFCLGSGPVSWVVLVLFAVCLISAGETQVWLGDLRVVSHGKSNHFPYVLL